MAAMLSSVGPDVGRIPETLVDGMASALQSSMAGVNNRKSTRSSPANLAEGFGAFYPGEFARFGRIARRSLIETRNHLQEARKRKYFLETDIRRLIHLTFRAQKATTRLIRYLDSCKHRPPEGWNFRR
jgi:four helix bundle protein